MILPLLLLVLAALSATVMAYGTHYAWAQYPQGMELILLARRIQWPLAGVSLACCLLLIALVVLGRRRAWWLIGLGPILALFVHRFGTDPRNELLIVDNPPLVAASEARFLKDGDYVVGLSFNGSPCAYPYASLYTAPVVVQANQEGRMILMWSAFANRAQAFAISHELHARDLEIVSMPADALLVYHARLGQFINGLTGATVAGEKPAGFRRSVATQKMTWGQWRQLNPKTRVMAPLPGRNLAPGAAGPLLPGVPLPPSASSGMRPETRVVLVATTQPLAVPASDIKPSGCNLRAGELPVLLFRDRHSGLVRAFDRRVEADLAPTFRPNTDPRRTKALFIDSDTDSGWSADGRAVDGPLARDGKRLAAVAVEEDLYWGVMKHWYPSLQLAAAPAP